MKPQEWTGDDERTLSAAQKAMRMASRVVSHLEPSFGNEKGPPPEVCIGAAAELRQCAELMTRLVDRMHVLQNPVRQFDPFTDRPEDPPKEPTE